MKNYNEPLATLMLTFERCGFTSTVPIKEIESAEYSAHSFTVNGFSTRYRVAKITPTKVGQFVTLWKRKVGGPIMPFDQVDDIDLFVVFVIKDKRIGQFVFPKSILLEQGILSTKTKAGKRALRVYPPWDKTTSKQAQKTQKWQLDYFIEFSESGPLDQNLLKLYGKDQHQDLLKTLK